MIVDKNKIISAVYDNGSTCSLINDRLVRELKTELFSNRAILKSLSGVDFCEKRATVQLKIGEIEDALNVCVVKNSNFNYDLLLGLDAIKKFRLLQDENLRIKQKLRDKYLDIALISETYLNVQEIELSHLSEDDQQRIKKVVFEFRDCFAQNKYDVGTQIKTEAFIKLKEDRYISKKPYRCSFPDQDEIDLQVSKLMENGLIEESDSPFASPVTLAFKKEDGRRTRLCIDFRELNKIVVPESHPFPRIDDLVVNVGECRWFTALDINSAFWSIPVREKDRMKTAFITQKGHWQWKVLPFGFKNSPAIFQRTLSAVLRKNNLSSFSVNYIDDILIFSKSLEEHVEHVTRVMRALRDEGFKLKLQKCSFATHSVKYLGHVIENGKIHPLKDNLTAIKNFPRPKTRKMVRQLLGKINFYHKFIDHCNQRLAPLHNLLKKDVKFQWTESCENTFSEIKNYLCRPPILAIYDRSKDVVLEVDASRTGLGAIFKQPLADGILHPIAYFSKKLTPSQTKREIIYLECLAIKEAILYWQHYLIGRPFVVTSDHKPLMNLRTKSRTDEGLGDMMLYLSQYDFKIIYKEGKENVEADSLSRNPVLETFDSEDDVIQVVNMIKIDEIIEDQKHNQNEITENVDVIQDGNISFKMLNNRKRIFVSKDFGIYLIKKLHAFYGHIGSNQLAETIRPFYYFKSMDKIIKEFCKTCTVCVQNKTRTGRAIGLMSKLGPAESPFQVMSIDTVGGFSGGRSTHKFFHLLVDHFSRYAWLRTSTGQEATDYIKLMDPIIKDNQIKTVLVDQYGAFTSKKFKTYLKNRNIQLVYTTVDNPQSNGLNERLNQTLVNRIRCRINENDTRGAWTKIAQTCVDEYNKTIHSTTGFQPGYLLHGEKVEVVPEELRVDADLAQDRLKALDNSQKSFKKNKTRVDKQRKDCEFQVGERVFVNNGSKLNRRKLDPVRVGPVRIVKKASNSMYELEGYKALFHGCKLVPEKNFYDV